MAFHGTLELDNKQYRILQWNIHVNQPMDVSGRPMANPTGGLISLTIESTGINDFFEWSVSPDMVKSGRISFQRRDNTSSLKTFQFTNAYCVDYYEEFNAEGTSPMLIRITISAMEVNSGTASLTKNWDKASIN